MNDQASTPYLGYPTWDTYMAVLWLEHDISIYQRAFKLVREPVDHEQIRAGLLTLIDQAGNPDNIDYRNVHWSRVIDQLQED